MCMVRNIHFTGSFLFFTTQKKKYPMRRIFIVAFVLHRTTQLIRSFFHCLTPVLRCAALYFSYYFSALRPRGVLHYQLHFIVFYCFYSFFFFLQTPHPPLHSLSLGCVPCVLCSLLLFLFYPHSFSCCSGMSFEEKNDDTHSRNHPQARPRFHKTKENYDNDEKAFEQGAPVNRSRFSRVSLCVFW